MTTTTIIIIFIIIISTAVTVDVALVVIVLFFVVVVVILVFAPNHLSGSGSKIFNPIQLVRRASRADSQTRPLIGRLVRKLNWTHSRTHSSASEH